jgi:glycosyltransferase involved in cell wall biosynthesis
MGMLGTVVLGSKTATAPHMRITIVQGAFLPVPPVLGGAVEKIWFALGKEFARRGHEVTHISRLHEISKQEECIDGVHHIRIPGFDTPRSIARLKWLDLIYSRRVQKILPLADILVTNTFWLPLLAPKAERGRICVHVARYPKGQMKLYFKAARLHTVSRAIQKAICKEAPGLASRVRVIPNCVDASTVQWSGCKRNTDILYVGRIHPEKGIHLLVDAFDRLVASGGFCDWRLRIVGPWEVKHGGGGERYFNALRKQSENLAHLVEWKGPVFDAEKLRSYYRQSAVFVYPSLAERGESFGVAPLEAMAEGCPPVVSSLECFQDFIRVGKNGWTFNHRSVDGAANLANVLSGVITEKDALARVGECALRTAQEFTLPKIANQYMSDFEEILCQ